MAHNPPRRLFSDDPEKMARLAREIEPRKTPAPPDRRWRDLFELACWISDRAYLGKHVRLTPATAHVVAGQLRTCHAKPTRDEVALMICRHGEANRCQDPCTSCRATANIVVGAYGCRLDEPQPGLA